MRFRSVRKAAFVILCTFILCISTAFADDFYQPFVGSGYFKGHDSVLGDVVVYVPINSKGAWGTSDSGYLYNVSSTSYSGVMYTKNGTAYTFSSSGFAFPRYRLNNSSSYNYTDLHLKVNESNLQVATEFPNAITISESIPFIMVGFMGVILFFMMRSKR